MKGLLDAAGFRELVGGQRHGGGAALARCLLAVLAAPYSLVVRARNAGFDAGLLPARRVAVPVVSVGNVTLGGTGKTPFVGWLAGWFQSRGVQVGLVSRGYKAQAGRPNDEARELAERLPGVPHVQDRDRVRGARRLLRDSGCELLVLDDAFQHRRIHRDLDIVLLDALEPFGFDRVFPRGTLREPLAGLARADVIALSRSEAVSETVRAAIRDRVRRIAPAADWLELAYRPTGLLAADGLLDDVANLAGRRVAAFCGIGNPAGFRHTLAACGCEVVAWREFPDHHAYDATDLADLRSWAESLPDVTTLVCTHKDLVKIGVAELGGRPLRALQIDLDVRVGRRELESRLESLVADRSTADART